MASFGVVGAIAGTVATLLFVGSALPMLIRAHRTRDLSSYSPANLIIANVGNLAQTLYVLTLPPGPVWAMHAFNLTVSGLMLAWWLRHHWLPRRNERRFGGPTTRARTRSGATPGPGPNRAVRRPATGPVAERTTGQIAGRPTGRIAGRTTGRIAGRTTGPGPIPTDHSTITTPSLHDATRHDEEEHSDDDPDHRGDRLGGPLARR